MYRHYDIMCSDSTIWHDVFIMYPNLDVAQMLFYFLFEKKSGNDIGIHFFLPVIGEYICPSFTPS